MTRPSVRGKFLFCGEEKLYLRGVTYGTFQPDEDGNEFNDPDLVDRDFAAMAAAGINAVRTYTAPPRWLLDTANRHGLHVMVGLPWEQHVTFLDDRNRTRDIESRVRAGVRACAGHPAVLCYAIGNEIPAHIVRWYGARKIERFLRRLHDAAKAEEPEALVTYVNYPSTEYLRLDFVDFLCFNVYLESQERLEAYLGRLQNLAGERPLVLAEVGLDSRRNGEDTQTRVLDWQISSIFGAGAAGAFVFAWTDEWYRGGYEIEDWDFGLTNRDRRPKPALRAVSQAFDEVPFPVDLAWPRISVVVCSHNGARTIADSCEGLQRLEYPDFEVIVVDDGSTDATGSIAAEFGFRVISTPNQGLSAARNVGLDGASGEIVAYIDDDARPDPHWLTYLAATFLRTEHAGVGGPNIAPPGDGWIADCVANAPGGPVLVLLSDDVAEHIPGCNMAYRANALRAIGGFDPRYRAAGDDVDMCWRLQERGWTIGFSPAAMVWHHRRNSVKAYWRQQKGYGKAEALLEEKWPERYNALGHITWGGRLYGTGLTLPLPWRRGRIYQGTWGNAPFQSIYEPSAGLLRSLPLMPEWYLLIGLLSLITALGVFSTPLLISAGTLLLLAVAALIGQGITSALRASFAAAPRTRIDLLRRRGTVAMLHVVQPLARLWGRLRFGLTVWRRGGRLHAVFPHTRTINAWSETWRPPQRWLEETESMSRAAGARTRRGSALDRWDLEVRGGLFGAARLLLAIEEHGGGRQQARFKVIPVFRQPMVILVAVNLGLAALFFILGTNVPAALFLCFSIAIGASALWECATSVGSLCRTLDDLIAENQ